MKSTNIEQLTRFERPFPMNVFICISFILNQIVKVTWFFLMTCNHANITAYNQHRFSQRQSRNFLSLDKIRKTVVFLGKTVKMSKEISGKSPPGFYQTALTTSRIVIL